jgi:hypothetical protein
MKIELLPTSMVYEQTFDDFIHITHSLLSQEWSLQITQATTPVEKWPAAVCLSIFQ